MRLLVSDRGQATLSGFTESNGLRRLSAIGPPTFKTVDLHGSNSSQMMAPHQRLLAQTYIFRKPAAKHPTRMLATQIPQNGSDPTPGFKVPGVKARARGGWGVNGCQGAGFPFQRGLLGDLR
jgi:hypothetical protein